MLREELYEKFGPILVEAVVQVVLQEVNILRVKAGLPERTSAEMINAIAGKAGDILSGQE